MNPCEGLEFYRHSPGFLANARLMNCDYIPAKLVQRACTGPLAPYIKPYINLMKQAGYVSAYVRENLTVLAAFGRRLERCGLGVQDVNEDVVDRFVRKRYPGRRPPRHVEPTMRRLLAMLRDAGATPLSLADPPPTPAQRLTNEYRHFLVEERAISPSTALCWCPIVLRFLSERFGSVGEAIARYLRLGRPPCDSRRVFIRSIAPRTGFPTRGPICSLVARALRRAGIASARTGAHLLRHSLATHMLAKGASLGEIGEVLRHRSADSTAIYAKVQLEALRPLALQWPGGIE